MDELSVGVLRPRICKYVSPDDSQAFVELPRPAGCIVSGDPHLSEVTDPVVLSPRRFLELLEANP